MERENKAILLFKQQIDQKPLLNKEKENLNYKFEQYQKMYLF